MRSLNRIAIFLFSFTSFCPVHAKAQSNLKNIVLVHGAFADGSSWNKVIPLLEAKGMNVIAVQLPLSSLEEDVAVTKRAIARMEGPVLLVGHSWAGVVITEAGNDPKVSGLVYISALVPDNGQAAADLGKGYPASPGVSEFKEDASGFFWLTAKGMKEDFVPDASPDEQMAIFVTQGVWAKKSLGQSISHAAWKDKPSWVIVDTKDRMVNPDLQREQAKKINATTIELTSGHVPMLAHPTQVGAFIIQAVDKLQAQ